MGNLEVVPITWRTTQKARYGVPTVEPGTVVWAIRHKPTSMFFEYAYFHEAIADKVMNTLDGSEYRGTDYHELPKRVVRPKMYNYLIPKADDGTEG
jgi:hypothetical protein